MSKSKNITEFKEAMKIHAIPMFNTGYADRDGKLYYVYNAKIPKRDPRYDWKKFYLVKANKRCGMSMCPMRDSPGL